MDGQMQEGPSDLSEFLGLTNHTVVLHDHGVNIGLDTFLVEQSLGDNELPVFPHNLHLAASCLETGIGIQVWALEKAWPGICDRLSWFDFIHPGILHPATTASINTMLRGEDTGNREFDCPVFVAESRHDWPRTCNNVKSPNMAEVRRHLTARAGRGYAPQLAFLELCPTCNEDFIDRDVFQTRHGYRGELCNARRPQRRGAKARVQWELLYRQVEATMAVQRLSTHREQFDTDPVPPQANFNTRTLAPQHVSEQPVSQLMDTNPDQTIPYLTPYQLIYPSDSDEEEMATSPHHTSTACSSGLEQSLSSHTSACTPEWPSITSFDARRPIPTHILNEEANRTSRLAILAPSQTWMSQLDTSTSHYVSHAGGSTSCSLTTLSSGPDWDDRMAAGGTDGTADCETPLSDYSQDIYHPRCERSLLLSDLRTDHTTIVGSGSYPPSPSMDLSQGVSSLRINLERTATPPLEVIRYPHLEQLDNAYLMPAAPRSFTPDTETNTTETDVSPEQLCDVEGCGAVFSGIYRKGNLARHKRLKHKGPRVYFCGDASCGRVFKRQDARAKHYRRWHPQLASEYHARPHATHAYRERYSDPTSSSTGWSVHNGGF